MQFDSQQILTAPYPDLGGTAAPASIISELQMHRNRLSHGLDEMRIANGELQYLRGVAADSLRHSLADIVIRSVQEVKDAVEQMLKGADEYSREVKHICDTAKRVRDEVLGIHRDYAVGANEILNFALGFGRQIVVHFNGLMSVDVAWITQSPDLDTFVRRTEWEMLVLAHNQRVHNLRDLQEIWRSLQEQREQCETKFAGVLRTADESLHTIMTGNRVLAGLASDGSDLLFDNGTSWAALSQIFMSREEQRKNNINSHRTPSEKLDWAIQNPRKAYAEMGFADSGLSYKDFVKQIRALKNELENPKNNGISVSLLEFGRHQDSLVAAIAYGDVKKAKRVGITIPGMYSDVEHIDSLGAASRDVLNAATKDGNKDDYAMIAWQGYDSPNVLEEFGMERAETGALRLRNTTVDLGQKEWVGYISHSYGTTMSGEAMKYSEVYVDSFIANGSAGLKTDTDVKDLHVGDITTSSADPEVLDVATSFSAATVLGKFAGRRDRDWIAGLGRSVGEHRKNPKDLKGAQDVKQSGNRSHDLYQPENAETKGYLTPGTESFNVAVEKLKHGGSARR